MLLEKSKEVEEIVKVWYRGWERVLYGGEGV